MKPAKTHWSQWDAQRRYRHFRRIAIDMLGPDANLHSSLAFSLDEYLADTTPERQARWVSLMHWCQGRAAMFVGERKVTRNRSRKVLRALRNCAE